MKSFKVTITLLKCLNQISWQNLLRLGGEQKCQPRGATTENVRIIKVIMIHLLSTIDNFMAVHPVAVEIFQSEVVA